MERRQKLCIVVKAFLAHPNYTMVELAQLPELKAIKIARQTIPKYLNDPTIINLFGAETYNRVQKLLKQNRIEINKRKTANLTDNRAIKSQKNMASKDFKQIQDNHVIVLTRIQLRYPNMTVEEITKLYNESNIGEELSVDYVTSCLSLKAKESVASKIMVSLGQKADEGHNLLTEVYKK